MNSPNVVCRLTATIPAALATIGVHGPDAIRIVWSKIHPPSPLGRKPPTPHFAVPISGPTPVHFAHWPISNGDVSEQVVICAMNPQLVEVHCHGGVAITEQILKSLQSSGCEVVDWEDWAARTNHQAGISCYVNSTDTLELATQSMDERRIGSSKQRASMAIRLRAERLMIEAASSRCVGILLDQYNGALWSSLCRLEQLVSNGERQAASEHVDRLLQWSSLGRHLSRPWQVVLAGPPNVGKSSLINALSGDTQSIVHHQPGTTRDWIEAATQIDGWPVVLTDTAGMRDTDEPIERQGVERARQRMAAADLVILVVDSSVGWTPEHDQTLRLCIQQPNPPLLLLAWNKSDLPFYTAPGMLHWQNKDFVSHSSLREIHCSAHQDVAQLWRSISEMLVPSSPSPGSAVPFTEQQISLLQGLARQLNQPLQTINIDWEQLTEYSICRR